METVRKRIRPGLTADLKHHLLFVGPRGTLINPQSPAEAGHCTQVLWSLARAGFNP